jgi:hypothetical protein
MSIVKITVNWRLRLYSIGDTNQRARCCGGHYWQENEEALREKPVPVSFQPPWIPHGLAQDWTLGLNPGLISPYPSHHSASSVCLRACVKCTCDCDEKCVYKLCVGSCSWNGNITWSARMRAHTHTHTHMHLWMQSCQAYVSFTECSYGWT